MIKNIFTSVAAAAILMFSAGPAMAQPVPFVRPLWTSTYAYGGYNTYQPAYVYPSYAYPSYVYPSYVYPAVGYNYGLGYPVSPYYGSGYNNFNYNYRYGFSFGIR